MCRIAIARFHVLAPAVSAAAAARPARVGILYTLKDLGALGRGNRVGSAVHASGQVAG